MSQVDPEWILTVPICDFRQSTAPQAEMLKDGSPSETFRFSAAPAAR